LAATVAPSSRHWRSTSLPTGPVTAIGKDASAQPRPLAMAATARTAPVVSLSPCT
jgi:hypothetical protein